MTAVPETPVPKPTGDTPKANGSRPEIRSRSSRPPDKTSSKRRRPTGRPTANSPSQKADSAAARLLRMAQTSVELFHSGSVAYAVLAFDDHEETWALNSKHFAQWLVRQYWLRFERTVSMTVINEVRAVLEAQAREAEERQVYLRVAPGPNNTLYIDLCDERWRAVRVAADCRYKVVRPRHVHFIRTPGMKSLPVPERGGSLNDLRKYLNVTDLGFQLVCAWLVSSIAPHGPYPILELRGEQGSAKSTTARFLRSLIDPHEADIEALPRNTRDLSISARNSWLLGYDNVSYIQPWMSDTLCRLSTGHAFRTRALYTDSEEVIFSACRPILLNGIEEVGTRPDLLDRTFLVELPRIPPGRRMDEQSLQRDFLRDRARIFGAMLDAASMALRRRESVSTDDLPRMADACRWALGAAPSFGSQEKLLEAMDDSAARITDLAFESNPVSAALLKFLKRRSGPWTGNADRLLMVLNNERLISSGDPRTPSGWPKTARQMGGMLHRLAPTLRSRGITVEFGRRRQWTLHLPRNRAKRPGKEKGARSTRSAR